MSKYLRKDYFLYVTYVKLTFLRKKISVFLSLTGSNHNRNLRNEHVYSRSLLCRIHVHESVAAGALFDARDVRCNTATHVVTCTSHCRCATIGRLTWDVAFKVEYASSINLLFIIIYQLYHMSNILQMQWNIGKCNLYGIPRILDLNKQLVCSLYVLIRTIILRE